MPQNIIWFFFFPVTRALDKKEKEYFSTEFLKLSIEIYIEGVKILNDILDFNIEIKFRG